MRRMLRGSNPIAWAVALCLICGCQEVRDFLRDPGGDDRIFTGDPNAFLGKEVIVQFRWGDRRVYGQAITCVVLGVEENEIIIRALHMHIPGNELRYSKLLRFGKLLPVKGQSEVFRIRRDDISRIFESAMVRPEE